MSTLFDRLSQILPGLEEGTDKAEWSATKVEQEAQDVRNNGAFRWFARLGLLGRAVVYLVLGALIIQIAANGRASSPADTQGAFSEVARQPAGTEFLALLAFGLAAYALWRFVEALSRTPEGQRASGWTRVGWLASGALYVALCVDVIRMILGSKPNEGPEQHPSSFAANVFQLPLGPELLGLIGAAVAAGGIALTVWGIKHDYGKLLQTTQMGHRTLTVARWTGVLGNTARGIAVLLVTFSLIVSAVSDNPKEAKSLDAALQALARTSFGAPLLIAVGIGFLSFGVYSVIEARFRRV